MAQTFYATVLHWVDVQATVGGVATFSPVNGGGGAVFGQIYAVQFTAESNTGVLTSMPVCALKSISADRKTITVNVGVGVAALAALGATVQAAPDGTKVHALIMGN